MSFCLHVFRYIARLVRYALIFRIPVNGLHSYQVYNTSEIFFSTDGQLYGNRTRTQAILKKTEQVFLVDTEERTYQAAESEVKQLPEGMEVELNTARSELTSETAGGIRFYPDGGSTGGNVRLEANGRIYRINVAWLTGEASVERPDD